jgi:(R,R)-butanediol dehydrogenase/meso-butanediol dehydrogenase/diacetyl reductase
MQAAYYHGNRTVRTGESIRLKPGPGEVTLEIAYCGICGTDLHIFQGHMDQRVSLPQVIGHETSGHIAEIGPQVTGWQVGDRVVVRPLAPCGNCPACQAGHSHVCYNLQFLGIDTPGAFQGWWTVPAYTLHRLPDDIPMDQAAMIEPLAVACHDVRRGQVQSGQDVVVIGGGPIGMLVALVARHKGANVLVSEINPFRVNLASRLGLKVVNPAETDLGAWVTEWTKDKGADVVFEVSGSAAGAATMTQLARVRGRIIVVAIFAQRPQVDLHRFFWRELELYGARVYESEDFDTAIHFAADRAIPLDKLISSRRPLSGLQQAFERLEASTDMMKILIDTQAE